MKHIAYLLLALACGTLSACMNGDGERWDAPVMSESPYGNNEIKETNVITIAQLKSEYSGVINTLYAYKQVADNVQIKGYVTGNDIGGNLYNEVSLQDETGAIIVAVAQGGLFGQLPLGAEVLVELKGLYVGNYGLQAEIGTPYTNSNGRTYVSRMPRSLWQQHYKLTGNNASVTPEVFADGSATTTWSLSSDGGKLGVIKNVSIAGASPSTTYADASAGSGSVSLYFNEQPRSVMLYTSNYAEFASNVVPQGKCNITGIFKRYNDYWEIIVRSLDDIEEVK